MSINYIYFRQKNHGVPSSDYRSASTEQARFLLSAIGDQIEVKDENLIDMATAVSGSGPAVISTQLTQVHHHCYP